MRKMWCGWWRLFIVGSCLLSLGQNAFSYDSGGSSKAKKRSAQAERTAPITKSHTSIHKKPISRRHPSSMTRQSQIALSRRKVRKTPSHRETVAYRSRRNGRHVRRWARPAFQAIPQLPPEAITSFSLLEHNPPLPPARTFAAALLADANTGQVLFSQNDHREWPTASLAKMMVALLTLEALERREVTLSESVTISHRASSQKGRIIRLRSGEEFPLEELLQAMMVTSANDAAIALAEHLKGSVEACVAAMNIRARQLGMRDTLFQTPNGLPLNDGTPPDISSAADLATLGRVLAKHPLLLEWTSLNRIPFREGRVSLPNTNHLVGRVPGVDGLKTGFTLQARYNLVTTAQRGPLRLIAVVLGGQSSGLRFRTAENLLEWGFAHFPRMSAVEKEPPLKTKIKVDQSSISPMWSLARH